MQARKNTAEMEAHANKFLSPTATYAINELDIHKCDKLQAEACQAIGMQLHRYLGLSDDLNQKWTDSHRQLMAKDHSLSVTIDILLQQQSGDPNTYNGNTCKCMVAVADTLEPWKGKMVAGFFSSDDSLIYTETELDVMERLNDLAVTYNFDAKLIKPRMGYFCSMHLVSNRERFAFISDVIKKSKD